MTTAGCQQSWAEQRAQNSLRQANSSTNSSMALFSDPSFTLPAEPSRWQQELPPGAWREVLLHLAPEQRFVAAMVCQAWRSHALSLLTPDLEVCLNSGASVCCSRLQGTAQHASALLNQATNTMLARPGIADASRQQLRSAPGSTNAHHRAAVCTSLPPSLLQAQQQPASATGCMPTASSCTA